MIPVAHIEHQLPGRVRLRVPSKRGDVSYFEKVVEELIRHPAVLELAASPLTGSITVLHTEPLQAIMDVAANLILFEMESKPGGEAGEAKRTERLSRSAGLTSNAAAGLTGLSLFQAVRGNVLGNAADSFWLSFSAQTVLGRPGLAAVFAIAGIWQMLNGRLLGSAASLFFYSMVMRDVVVVQEARACNRRAPKAAN